MKCVGELGGDGQDDVVRRLTVRGQLGDPVDPPDSGPPPGARVSDSIGPQRDPSHGQPVKR